MNSQLSSKIFHVITFRVLVIGLCAIVPLSRCHGAKREVFFEPGLFSIETPDAGFSWKKLQIVQNAKTTTHYFTCKQNDRPSPLIVLLVDERQANTDAQRRVIIKAHFKALQGVVVRSGFKIDSKRPHAPVLPQPPPQSHDPVAARREGTPHAECCQHNTLPRVDTGPHRGDEIGIY